MNSLALETIWRMSWPFRESSSVDMDLDLARILPQGGLVLLLDRLELLLEEHVLEGDPGLVDEHLERLEAGGVAARSRGCRRTGARSSRGGPRAAGPRRRATGTGRSGPSGARASGPRAAGPLKARRSRATSWNTEASPSGIVTWRASRLSVSSRGASPKPPRPRASSFLTTNSSARSKNSRATFITRIAIWLASPPCRRSTSRRFRNSKGRAASSERGASSSAPPGRRPSSSRALRGGARPPRPAAAARRSPAWPRRPRGRPRTGAR